MDNFNGQCLSVLHHFISNWFWFSNKATRMSLPAKRATADWYYVNDKYTSRTIVGYKVPLQLVNVCNVNTPASYCNHWSCLPKTGWWCCVGKEGQVACGGWKVSSVGWWHRQLFIGGKLKNVQQLELNLIRHHQFWFVNKATRMSLPAKRATADLKKYYDGKLTPKTMDECQCHCHCLQLLQNQTIVMISNVRGVSSSSYN